MLTKTKTLCAVPAIVAVLTIAAAVGPLVSPAAGGEAAVPVYYQLTLEGALFDGHPDEPRDIIVDLERVGDHWGPAYGVARNYNMAFHRGAVHDVETADGSISIALGMTVTPDPWKPGGQGDYRIELSPDGEGELTGSFTGAYEGVEVRGPVRATVYEPEVADGHKPLRPQEHPRLLLREHELAEAREKFDTPFGRAARRRLESSGTPASLGLLYQLTGDESYAEKALAEAEEYLAGNKPGGNPFRPRAPLAERLEQLALFYDLCYDAIPDDYKARYRAYAGNLMFQVYFAPASIGRTNWNVMSNHVADVYSGLTMTALVLFDAESEPPTRPSEPFLDDVLPPAEGFQPGLNVPVVELAPGRSPHRWLHTEPLRTTTPDDPREVFYGLEQVRAEPGTKVQVGEFELTFGEQDPDTRVDADDEAGGLRVYDMLEAHADARLHEPFTMVAYTVIEVSEPGRYKVNSPCSRANLMQVALNGELLTDGQVVELREGLYPMMVKVQWRMRWGRIGPTLTPADDEDAAGWREEAELVRRRYETRLRMHEAAEAAWERTGGGNPAFDRILRLSRFTSVLHNTHAVGRGGFQAEVGGYSLEAMRGHARLWPAWRRVKGYDITPGMEYPDVIPRKIIGGPQDINGTTRIGGDFFSALFPVVRSKWQPEVLTAWRREMGVTGEDTLEKVLNADPARAFLNYPLDMEAAPIGTNLPRHWEAPDFGYYAFRSGWGDDAFVAQVFLKSQNIGGWNGPNAGTFRLRGLGRNWAVGPTDRVRRRQQENVVWMPEGELWDGGLARLTYLHADEDTMVLSADMDLVYERPELVSVSAYGHIIRRGMPEDGPAPSGISGSRSLAFDYSGKSGAPCLFVVVDRIDGGEDVKRFWLFQPPTDGKSVSDIVSTGGDGSFVIRPEEASATLRGRFAHPSGPEVNTDPLEYEYVKTWGQQRGQTHTVQVDALTVPGGDHFFFVGTVTDGEHPEVKVEGEGLDAVITVGGRTVRFDGEKVILGDN